MAIPPQKTIMDLPRIDLTEYINWILANFKFNNYWEADRVLKKHYETVFGIFDHRASQVGSTRPWSGMAHLPGNSLGKYYDIEYLIDKYEENGIWDILHIDFHEYITYPPIKMKELDDKCRTIKDRKAKKKEEEEAEGQRQLANQFRTTKGNGQPQLPMPRQ